MSAYDHLKNTVDEARQLLNEHLSATPDLSSKKLENEDYALEKAVNFLNELLQTIEYSLKEKTRCVKYVSPQEMRVVKNTLKNITSSFKRKNYDNFVVNVEELNSNILPFSILLCNNINLITNKLYTMEKLSQEYNKKIESALNSIVDQQKKVAQHALGIKSTLDSIDEKKKEIAQHAASTKSALDSVEEKRAEIVQYVQKAKSSLGSVDKQKNQIDAILNDVEEQNKIMKQFDDNMKIHEQKMQERVKFADDYKNQVEEFQEQYKKHVQEHETKRKELIETAEGLIIKARHALGATTAHKLGAAFHARQEKLSDKITKRWWIGVVIGSSVCAIGIGLYTVMNVGEDAGNAIILLRSLLIFIALGVAGFAGKQYSKNKAAEEDYAYKAALVQSYPGLAEEFAKDPGLREEYVRRLLEEILQDPQRIRVSPESLSHASKELKDAKNTDSINTEAPRDDMSSLP